MTTALGGGHPDLSARLFAPDRYARYILARNDDPSN
jgi:hypothetical protein